MLRAHWGRNLHSPGHGKSLAAEQCICSSRRDLQNLGYPTAYGIFHQDSHNFCAAEEDVRRT